jgi:hypothetical protein
MSVDTLDTDFVVEVDIDAELGFNAYWSASLSNLVGGEGTERQSVPAPPCFVPRMFWHVQTPFRSDRLLLWRDSTPAGQALFNEGVVLLGPGVVNVLNLRVDLHL